MKSENKKKIWNVMMPKRNTPIKRIHVTSRSKGWAVKKEGLSKASKIYKTKASAVNGARRLRSKGLDIVVHKRDGTIQKWEKSKK